MNTDVPQNNPATLTAKIVGVGGAGSNAVEHMIRAGGLALAFATVHTNRRILNSPVVPNKLLIGANRLHGMGAGGDPELARTVAEEETGALKTFCSDADLIFIVAGMGGGTGTGAAPIVARAAKQSGALVLAIVTLPFDFEGPRRKQQAEAGLKLLRAEADAVICLPNQKLFKLVDENTSVLDAFKLTNDLLFQGVRGVWQMLTRPGLINVDFAYLYSVLRGTHVESSFATAEATDENRSRDLVTKLLANPLLDGGSSLMHADAILVSLVGGPDMSMADVNRVMEALTRQTDSGQIIMGAAVDPEFHGRLGLTVIVSRQVADLKSEEPACPAIPTVNSGLFARETAPAETSRRPDIQGENGFLEQEANSRPHSRFIPPAPNLTPEKKQDLLSRQTTTRGRKAAAKLKQQQLPLEIISKGRFEKSEPTVHHGEDLDIPTYIRRGIALN